MMENNNAQTQKQSLSLIKAIAFSIPIAVKQSPSTLLKYMGFILVGGILAGILTPLTEQLFNGIADLPAGYSNVTSVVLWAVTVVGIRLILHMLGGYRHVIEEYFYEVKRNKLLTEVYNKIGKLPAQVFENTEKLEDLHRVSGAAYKILYVTSMVLDIVFDYMVFFSIMGIYLWRINPILLLIFLVVFIPTALSQIFFARLYAGQSEMVVPYELRRDAYYTDKNVTWETRYLGAFNYFYKKWADSHKKVMDIELDVAKKAQWLSLGLGVTKTLGWVGIVVVLFFMFSDGDIAVGAIAAIFTAIGLMFNKLEGAFDTVASNAINSLGDIHNFIRFMEWEESRGWDSPKPDIAQGITASNISFSYPPHIGRPAINDVSITIASGETIALVGENGSGKTTLVKLLCGLYKPDSGIVTIGSQDTVATSDDVLFDDITAVFQECARYEVLSLKECVAISRYDSKQEVSPYLDDFEVHYRDIGTFPNGLDTIMSIDLGGAELSDGQWQRLAMSRGIFRAHNFIVLDEPTSAIDPMEETRIYKQFVNYSKDKTAIIVTHRLGSARIADRIIVMDKGSIVEVGTHEELLSNKGKYTAMWDAQAQWYVRKSEDK